MYRGRFLSLPEWYSKRKLIEAIRGHSINPLEWRVAVRHLVDAMFPATGPPWWQVWTWGRPRPRRLSDLILELPERTQVKILGDFIRSQTVALETETATPTAKE